MKDQDGQNLLTLDVGFNNMGFAVLNDGKPIYCGVLTAKKSTKKMARVADEYSYRASSMARQLTALIQEKYIYGIVGELPSAGAQNATAMMQMGMANSLVSSVATVLNIPTEWTTPREVKIAATGYASATKRMMCEAVIQKFGGKVEHHKVKCRKSKGFPDGVRTDQKYSFLGTIFPEGTFEHIADALGSYLALQDGVLARLMQFKNLSN